MKIIEYLHTTRGGHMSYTRALAEALAEIDQEVYILTGRDARPDDKIRAVITVPNLALRSPSFPWLINRLATYVRQPRDVVKAVRAESRTGNDWVHLQQLPTIGAARMVTLLRKIGWRVAITVHNVEPHERGRLAGWLHQRQVRAWSQADLLIVHSPRLALPLASAIAPRGVPRVESVPHPVWVVDRRDDIEPTRDFLFFGHLRHNKGVDDFVRALGELGDPPATIAGSGTATEVANLHGALAAVGLTNCTVRVEFVPEEEVPGLFADHRLVVAPYREFSAQSGVTHLALAHMRPIVVTDVGGLGELVNEFAVGEIVGPREGLDVTMLRARARAIDGDYGPCIERARTALDPVAIAKRLVACMDES